MLAQQFLPEPGAKSERRYPALVQAETAGTIKFGQGRQLCSDAAEGARRQ